MDLANIRADLAEALDGFDFNVQDVLDAPVLPCIMVGMPESITYSSMRDCIVRMPIHIMVNMADSEDAQNRISMALSNRGPFESVLDAVRTAKSDYFQAIKIVEVTNFTLIPEFNNALSCDITVELLATNVVPSPGS